MILSTIVTDKNFFKENFLIKNIFKKKLELNKVYNGLEIYIL